MNKGPKSTENQSGVYGDSLGDITRYARAYFDIALDLLAADNVREEQEENERLAYNAMIAKIVKANDASGIYLAFKDSLETRNIQDEVLVGFALRIIHDLQAFEISPPSNFTEDTLNRAYTTSMDEVIVELRGILVTNEVDSTMSNAEYIGFIAIEALLDKANELLQTLKNVTDQAESALLALCGRYRMDLVVNKAYSDVAHNELGSLAEIADNISALRNTLDAGTYTLTSSRQLAAVYLDLALLEMLETKNHNTLLVLNTTLYTEPGHELARLKHDLYLLTTIGDNVKKLQNAIKCCTLQTEEGYSTACIRHDFLFIQDYINEPNMLRDFLENGSILTDAGKATVLSILGR